MHSSRSTPTAWPAASWAWATCSPSSSAHRLRRNTFTLDDFLGQMQQLKRMGPLGGLLEMMPGFGGMARDAQAAVDSGQLTRVEAIIQSMTRAERVDPSILNASRRRRIARGSGTSLQDVNRLVKQFGEMQKLIKQLGGGRRGRLPGLPFG
jgi:signal recognition particle subunit SRP54